MSPHTIVRSLVAAALIAVPSLAMAAPDQNTNNNGCPNGQWVNGRCTSWNNNTNNNNGQWNDDRRRRDERAREEERARAERDRDRDRYNNNGYNNGYNGGYNNGYGNYGGNGAYNNGTYGNRGGQLGGTVSSFSPYNLYLSNGMHVVLHNGTVINPTGANLTSGQRVRIVGNRNGDGTFSANEIDVEGNTGGWRR